METETLILTGNEYEDTRLLVDKIDPLTLRNFFKASTNPSDHKSNFSKIS
jgi:hypothetical protein